MASRIQHDPKQSWVAVGRLRLGLIGSQQDRVRDGRLDIVNLDLEVHQLRLCRDGLRPHGADVPVLRLHVDTHAARRVAQHLPSTVLVNDVQAEQVHVERDDSFELLGMATHTAFQWKEVIVRRSSRPST